MKEMSTAKPKSAQKYSPASIIVAVLLGLTFMVLLQFIAKDLTNTFIGPRPSYTATYTRAKDGAFDDENSYEDFSKLEMMPYNTKVLLLKAALYTPIFLLALGLKYTNKGKETTQLATTTFFAATALTMFGFLFSLAAHIYQINQRLAMYGISFVLIATFLVAISYIQKKQAAH